MARTRLAPHRKMTLWRRGERLHELLRNTRAASQQLLSANLSLAACLGLN
jgi:hypothetical protein